MNIEANCITLRLVTTPEHGCSKESRFLRFLLIFDIYQSGCRPWQGEEGGHSGRHTHTLCVDRHTRTDRHTHDFSGCRLWECVKGGIPAGTHTLCVDWHTRADWHTQQKENFSKCFRLVFTPVFLGAEGAKGGDMFWHTDTHSTWHSTCI
jgi:hypothetical protein